jgi:hypothetical protein
MFFGHFPIKILFSAFIPKGGDVFPFAKIPENFSQQDVNGVLTHHS